jgi:WhiB family transcriptional regulator, redox-sensing transcriptional regulator
MTRARVPRPHEVAAARRDPRLLRAAIERQTDTAWRTRGVCQTVDPETFFPAPTDPPDAAVALCGTCPVQGPCLAWALEAGDCHGVWGGTTARERRAMVVAWRTPEQPEERPYAEVEDATALVVGGTIPAPGWAAAQPSSEVGLTTLALRGKHGSASRRRPPSTDRPSAAVGIVQHAECGQTGAERSPVLIPLQHRPLELDQTAPLEALVG